MSTTHVSQAETIESTQRANRRAVLQRASGLCLAGIILNYNLILNEQSDPVEVILDFEYPCNGRSLLDSAKLPSLLASN